VAQLAAIPKDSQRLRETQRCRIDAPHASYYPSPNTLKPANEQLRRIDFGQMPVVEIERPQEFRYIQWVAATGGPHRLNQSIVGPAAHRGADEHADGFFPQQPRTQNR
jgi:hypothetical protein